MKIGTIHPAERPAGFAERQCDAVAKVVVGTHHHAWRIARFAPHGMDPMRCARAGSVRRNGLKLCPFHARLHDTGNQA